MGSTAKMTAITIFTEIQLGNGIVLTLGANGEAWVTNRNTSETVLRLTKSELDEYARAFKVLAFAAAQLECN